MNPDHAVVDISHWQDCVDFEAMAEGGVVGVIHKATESTAYVDADYAPRRPQAEAAGLLWGAYHFLRPGDMIAQARHFVAFAGDVDLYAADHEDPGVSLDDLKTFLREVEALTGTKPIIYSGHVIKEQVDGCDPDLAPYRLWLAHYDESPSWPKDTWPDWWLWQHTDTGKCPGITGNVDCNRYDGSAEDLEAEWREPSTSAPAPVRKGPITITITITADDTTVTVVRG